MHDVLGVAELVGVDTGEEQEMDRGEGTYRLHAGDLQGAERCRQMVPP